MNHDTLSIDDLNKSWDAMWHMWKLPDEFVAGENRMALDLHPYTKKLFENQAQEIDRRLALLGLSQEEISRRAYRVLEDDGSIVYYFDGRPIIRSYFKYEGYKITAIVESL